MSSRTHQVTRAAFIAVLAWLAVLSPAAPPTASADVRQEGPIWEGVWFQDRAHPEPIRSVSVHVAPSANARFKTLVSGDRVDGGREVVSGMCHRAGAVACVNAHFSICRQCDQPFGGIVREGVIIRTPTVLQHQVSVVDGRFSLDPWPWSAGLMARSAKNAPALEIAGINTGDVHDGIVLRTRDYGSNTRAPGGAYEVAIQLSQELYTGLDAHQQVQVLGVNAGGHTEIPVGGAVLTGLGAGGQQLQAFVEAHGSALELVTHTPGGLQQSFAGHPVLIRNGQRQDLDPRDPKISSRHPRTLLGWNDAGDVWVVVVDGRQPHSRGMTLFEAMDHMASFGATNAVNLDGGGSSAMVTVCPSPSGWCLRNSPSDGRERAVTTALAIVPTAAPPTRHAGVAEAVEEQPPAPETSAPAAPDDVSVEDPTATSAESDPPTADVEAEGRPESPAVADVDTASTPPPAEEDDQVETSELATRPAAPEVAPLVAGERALRPVPEPGDQGMALDLPLAFLAALALVGYAVLAVELRHRWLVSRGRGGLPSRTGTGRVPRPTDPHRGPSRQGAGRR